MIIKHNGREIQLSKVKRINKREITAWVQYWIDKRAVELGMPSDKFIKEVLRK